LPVDEPLIVCAYQEYRLACGSHRLRPSVYGLERSYVMPCSLIGGSRLMQLANSRENVKRLEDRTLSTILERRAEGRVEAGLNGNQIFIGIQISILLFLTVHSHRYIR
jgi:hypothetical protein